MPNIKEIFLVFLKIGSVAFGGVYSMLSFFEREIVQKKKWLTHDDFMEAVVIGQMTPGAPIVNTGIFIGYKLKRFLGAVSATIGQILPSFLLILFIGYFYFEYREVRVIHSALKGVGAAVVGLIASVVIKMAKGSLKNPTDWSIAVLSFLGLLMLRANPIAIILLFGALGMLIFKKRSSVSAD